MPEIAEIARVVHYLRLHLVGKTIKFAKAIEDTSVFGKVGTSGEEVEKALTGRKVLSAGTQGKYFWLVLDKPPHPVMHFGMTGWMHIKGDRTAYTNYYKKMKPEELDAWPPKHWKFHLKTEQPAVEVAFTDPRRFGRVRLVDCPGESIRKFSPLVENGPDPVVDTDVFTKDYLRGKMRSRRVPIKALILDQTVISGVGNWVGDEVLYQAKLHPEQYCDDFSDEQVDKLFEAIRYVCQFAVDKLGDSDQFPQDWLFHYRWGKGQKGAAGHLPNGEKLAFITVGGRTSCYAPEVQKKSGRVAPGAKEELVESDQEEQKPKKTARAKAVKVEDEKPSSKKRKVKEEQSPVKGDQPPPDGRPAKKGKTTKTDETATSDVQSDETQKRRSGRLQNKAA